MLYPFLCFGLFLYYNTANKNNKNRVLEVSASAVDSQGPTPIGSQYTIAQTLEWSDDSHFLVGRWDSSYQLFSATSAGVTLKSIGTVGAGIQMTSFWRHFVFFGFKPDSLSILDWTTNRQLGLVSYDSKFGVANCGLVVGERFLTGHENGFVVMWTLTLNAPFIHLTNSINISSPNPIPSPYPLKNIRGLALISFDQGVVVTGSEDGDLCVLKIPELVVVSRRRYNPSAQRGINSISAVSPLVLVSNCAVGISDSNTWLFRIDGEHNLSLQDSTNLAQNTSLSQVFNFVVKLFDVDGFPTRFVAGTQEGLVWYGNITDRNKFSVNSSPLSVCCGYAPALAIRNGVLASAGNAISTYSFR